MLNTFLGKAETGKLVVSAIAFCVDPSGIAATALSLDAAIEARNKFFTDHPGLAKLAKQIDRDFKELLATKAYDKPIDARELLPQMLDHALSQPDEFVQCGLNPRDILRNLRTRFKNSEEKDYRRDDIQDAFERIYKPLLTKACNDTGLFAALQPALYREMLEAFKATLSNPTQSSSAQLREAAQFFDDAPDDTATDFQLMSFLQAKAEDIARLKQDREDLPPTLPRLANVRAEVDALINDLRLDEAEERLDDAREIVKQETLRPALEANAELDEQKAEILILRGRISDAFDLLSAVADSFATLDPLEPARRRLKYEDLFYAHGLRFGGTGLALSQAMLRTAISLTPESSLLWAEAKNAEAIALQNQGIRTAGPDGTALLVEAVTAYRDALTVRTKAEHPVDWAMTTQNLATTLQTQGTRTDGPDGTALLAEAVSAYHNALTIFTKADHPVDWAMTTQNLAQALQTQGIRSDGPDGTALLAEAVTAYRDALTVRTKSDHPVHWATTTQNLAIALKNQGTRTDGPDGTALLAEAVSAYRDALTVRTKADHPVHWADTTQNLANALQDQGTRTDGLDGTALLAEAVTAYRDALTVRTRADHPVDWAMTQENLALAEEAIADHKATENPHPHLQTALNYVDASLTIFDPDHMSFNHAKATRVRDRILAKIAALDG